MTKEEASKKVNLKFVIVPPEKKSKNERRPKFDVIVRETFSMKLYPDMINKVYRLAEIAKKRPTVFAAEIFEERINQYQ